MNCIYIILGKKTPLRLKPQTSKERSVQIDESSSEDQFKDSVQINKVSSSEGIAFKFISKLSWIYKHY